MKVSVGMDLRPYQLEALESVEKIQAAGQNRGLIKMPTGTGKTVMFAAMPERLAPWLAHFPADSRRMLVIAHREELLDQAADKIKRQNPGLMVSIEQGDRHANSYSDVIIASIQTLSAMKFRRLERLLKRVTFRIVIVDEAHHAAASTYRGVLARLGFLPPELSGATDNIEGAAAGDVELMRESLQGWDARAPKDRLLIGVTATPNRSDAIGLGCVFQTIAYSYALKQAIEDRWLVPIKPWIVETTESLDDVRISRGDFNQKDLADAVNTPRRNRLAVDAWKLYAGDRSTLAFTVDVQHAHDLAAEFTRIGINARALSGETPKDERRAILEAYTAGDVQVITNCMVLTEGTDLPRTGCILHAKPTKSATLYEQMTGRGLRLFDGKPDCVIIDLVDVARRHSLQAAPVLYGLPPSVKTRGEDLRKTAEEAEQLRAKYPQFDIDAALAGGRFSIQELLDRASTFDVWTVPALGLYGEGLSMNWIRFSEDTFRLQYPWQDGTEILEVRRDVLEHFDVVSMFRPRVGGVRQRTLAAQVTDASAALKLAEAFVEQERRSVMKLKDREAPWRQRPASEKQIAMLRRLRAPFKHGITMGEASDLIDLGQSRRRM